MGFHLGRRSLRELKGVHPHLVAVVKRAIKITTVDFSVHDGIRTSAEQMALVERGASTLRPPRGRHLAGPDGHGHAVDLVPYVNGKLRWEWPLIYPIAEAMRAAAMDDAVLERLGLARPVPIRWGGAWDRRLTGPLGDDPQGMVEDYVERRRRQGRRAFIDGPHYELPKSIAYP